MKLGELVEMISGDTEAILKQIDAIAEDIGNREKLIQQLQQEIGRLKTSLFNCESSRNVPNRAKPQTYKNKSID